MCEYQENIDAAGKWKPGDVIRDKDTGRLYTVTPDLSLFSHYFGSPIAPLDAEYYWERHRDSFEVLT